MLAILVDLQVLKYYVDKKLDSTQFRNLQNYTVTQNWNSTYQNVNIIHTQTILSHPCSFNNTSDAHRLHKTVTS